MIALKIAEQVTVMGHSESVLRVAYGELAARPDILSQWLAFA